MSALGELRTRSTIYPRGRGTERANVHINLVESSLQVTKKEESRSGSLSRFCREQQNVLI